MSKKQKVHSLTGRITLDLVNEAFQTVKGNRGAAGIDKVSIRMFDSNCVENLTALMRDLKTGKFQPLPLKRVYIPKSPTKMRPLGIPAVRDRVAQEVVRKLINSIFDNTFHDDSCGFREGRSCHQAVEKLLEHYRKGYKFVLDADIKGFFDNIPHKVIMNAVASEVADGNILRLIEKFLKSGVMENGVFNPTSVGTPQGGVISPLLANIVLNHLDWELHKDGYLFVRYADDFVVLCKTKQQAEEALQLVQASLNDLGLKLSPEKTIITNFRSGFSFLGFDITSRSIRMRDKSVRKFKDKIRELTIRCHNLDAEVFKKLNLVIKGTANYFATSFSNCYYLFTELDKWIRMRIRCMKYKRKSRNDNFRLRLKHLRRLGLLFMANFCRN
jgi:RNA-directed DNA polymerase